VRIKPGFPIWEPIACRFSRDKKNEHEVFAPRVRRRRKPENPVVKKGERSKPPPQIYHTRRRRGGGGGGGVYLESYTREARFLTRWDQHAVAQRREEEFIQNRTRARRRAFLSF